MSDSKVRFIQTTKSKFIALSQVDENALYFITDTQEIYKGNESLSFSTTLVSSPSSISTLEDWKDFMKQLLAVIPLGSTKTVEVGAMTLYSRPSEGTPDPNSVIYFDSDYSNEIIRVIAFHNIGESGDEVVGALMALTTGMLEVVYSVTDNLVIGFWRPTTLQWQTL